MSPVVFVVLLDFLIAARVPIYEGHYLSAPNCLLRGLFLLRMRTKGISSELPSLPATSYQYGIVLETFEHIS
jgi:hypothetical protein